MDIITKGKDRYILSRHIFLCSVKGCFKPKIKRNGFIIINDNVYGLCEKHFEMLDKSNNRIFSLKNVDSDLKDKEDKIKNKSDKIKNIYVKTEQIRNDYIDYKYYVGSKRAISFKEFKKRYKENVIQELIRRAKNE